MKKKISLEDAIEDLKKNPTIPVWPHLGLLLDMSRGSAYGAVARGEIECARFGGSLKPISAALRKKLGIEAA